MHGLPEMTLILWILPFAFLLRCSCWVSMLQMYCGIVLGIVNLSEHWFTYDGQSERVYRRLCSVCASCMRSNDAVSNKRGFVTSCRTSAHQYASFCMPLWGPLTVIFILMVMVTWQSYPYHGHNMRMKVNVRGILPFLVFAIVEKWIKQRKDKLIPTD